MSSIRFDFDKAFDTFFSFIFSNLIVSIKQIRALSVLISTRHSILMRYKEQTWIMDMRPLVNVSSESI